ncbi:Protein ALWAYS EARLY 3 [Quillaja saponaria]|uniref:Protein ALWAYS EARLY 3 n=1 Tax=Quillaja saponaria TaxID=32244 RepID=A0AAD7PH95_QUISA|nr:Protein ALWAYS EARLY 3 [Quillaja saponaria]
MAPSKKSKSVNKRYSYVSEVASDKHGESANKSRQHGSPGIQKKRKLADMLGPQWSKRELERFYEAYRKYGKDWKKVAAAVRNRSLEMVEALYTMNKAYLSLPEGTASVVGLIAMMTDHYCVLGGSDSEQESNEDTEASRKPQKRMRGKVKDNNYTGLELHFPDHSESRTVASSNSCLSLLKKRHPGIRPHAVRKRTPRIPVSYSFDKDNGEKCLPTARKGLKQMVDTNDDVAHKIALALTEASQRGGSPQLSRTPSRKTKALFPSPGPNNEKKHVESVMAGIKFPDGDIDEGSSELSLGSTEDDNGCYRRKKCHLKGREVTGKQDRLRKGNKYYRKKLEESINNHLDDIKEASSGTEEGQKLHIVKANVDAEVADAKLAISSFSSSRKRSKKVLFQKDEDSDFDALQTLADLSLMMPETNPDAESSALVKEENCEFVNESKLKGKRVSSGAKVSASKIFNSDNAAAVPEAKEKADQLDNGMRKRKQKSLAFRISNTGDHSVFHLSGSQKTEVIDEVKKSLTKGKRSSLNPAHSKQVKMVKPSAKISSNADDRGERDDSVLSPMKGSSENQINLAKKGSSRRKMDKPKSMVLREPKFSGNNSNIPHNKPIPPVLDSLLNVKGKLFNCLSSHQARRWCTFEWFYSAIDYPWFAKREFMEYLDHVGLGHVPRLTRIEWGVIRSSLGRPRRFSEQFLMEEKKKLNQYRESVRSHYAELLAGSREGLPTDLARPLFVGQRVIAIHPKTREIHDGSILTFDHCRCRVQFDQPDLGVEFVMDIDCMPLNPLENMPESLMRHNVAADKLYEKFIELKINAKLQEGKNEEYEKCTHTGNQDNVEGPYISSLTHHISNISKQAISSSSVLKAKIVDGETGYNQEVARSQPGLPAKFQPKEADVLAISELTRALDKKEVVLSELKYMNDEFLESQKNGNNSLKDSEPFKRHYASVLLQLNEVNDQVSAGLFCLRQRNTYQGSSSLLSSKPLPEKWLIQLCRQCCVLERMKIRIERIEEAINFVSNRLSMDESATAMCFMPDSVHVAVASQDPMTASTSNPLATSQAPNQESNFSFDQNEVKIPSELIAQCLATLLMIQKCTERQFPPADVAQLLDSAVTSLQPFCSKNLPIYAEIQKCMGIIRNQILALVPT